MDSTSCTAVMLRLQVRGFVSLNEPSGQSVVSETESPPSLVSPIVVAEHSKECSTGVPTTSSVVIVNSDQRINSGLGIAMIQTLSNSIAGQSASRDRAVVTT